MKEKGENTSTEVVEQVETTIQNEMHMDAGETNKQEKARSVKNKQNKSEDEKVTFRLFKDNDKYKAPVFVGVNGVGYLVERGKDVTMPKFVYEVLKNSEEQLAEAAKTMEEAENSEY